MGFPSVAQEIRTQRTNPKHVSQREYRSPKGLREAIVRNGMTAPVKAKPLPGG